MRHLIRPLAVAMTCTFMGCGDAATDSTSAAATVDISTDSSAAADLADSNTAEEATDTPSGAPDGEGQAAVDTATESSSEDTTEERPPEDTPQTSPCAFPLVELQTAKDPACGGGNLHRWPIGMAGTACHGWRAMDNSGEEHDNSANAIGCGEDGSFTFTQFAGNLDCSGSGVVKTYTADACEQDTPPVLYTKAINLACCESLTHPDCVTGLPSVSIPGGQVFLDGDLCE
ncbi:MAG: hypothetical protein ACPGU1_20165 [Myxococcota bacterium]